MVTIAEPLPATLLSLPRFAKLLGINPVHFSGAVGPAGAFPMITNACSDVWPHYAWQYADNISHYDLALVIQGAEADITRELGWSPAPVWTYEEIRDFPRYYRKDAYRRYGRNVRGQRVSVQTRFGKVISPGQRNPTFISTPTLVDETLVYSDEDGDGFLETATVTAETTLTNALEIQVFVQGTLAHPGWRIWPARSRSIADGVFTAVFDSWLFIDPDILGRYPSSDGFAAIDLSTGADKFVDTVDVYRIYNDISQTSAQFMWEPAPAASSAFCLTNDTTAAGVLTTQDGTLHVRDAELGIVVPEPATYSASSLAWTQDAYVKTRDPDIVKIWYYAGEYSNDYLALLIGDPLSRRWAIAIAQMTVGRLERPLCSCGNTGALAKLWQVDTARLDANLRITDEELGNPFGTHYGEILAWRTVRKERRINRRGGAI